MLRVVFCHTWTRACLISCQRSWFMHRKTRDVGTHLTCDLPRSTFQDQERKTRSMSVLEPNRRGPRRRRGRTRPQRRREARRRRREREEAARMRGASFHCDLFASNLLRLLQASNFRVPKGSRFVVVLHAHGAPVTWTSDDQGHRTPGRGTRSLVYTTPSTPFRAGHPYTTLDQSSPEDEPIITANDNLQVRPERRSTGATTETMHDMLLTGNHRSGALEEDSMTAVAVRHVARDQCRNTTGLSTDQQDARPVGRRRKLRTGRQCGRGRSRCATTWQGELVSRSQQIFLQSCCRARRERSDVTCGR